MADEAGAIYGVDEIVLINRDIFDEYLEQFQQKPCTYSAYMQRKYLLQIKKIPISFNIEQQKGGMESQNHDRLFGVCVLADLFDVSIDELIYGTKNNKNVEILKELK